MLINLINLLLQLGGRRKENQLKKKEVEQKNKYNELYKQKVKIELELEEIKTKEKSEKTKPKFDLDAKLEKQNFNTATIKLNLKNIGNEDIYNIKFYNIKSNSLIDDFRLTNENVNLANPIEKFTSDINPNYIKKDGKTSISVEVNIKNIKQINDERKKKKESNLIINNLFENRFYFLIGCKNSLGNRFIKLFSVGYTVYFKNEKLSKVECKANPTGTRFDIKKINDKVSLKSEIKNYLTRYDRL